jgi:hypothetical protein
MADGLTDLGAPVEDRILVLNILRGLNQRFKHVGSIIRCYSPFLNFLKVWDDLLLKEIHMDSTGPPAAPTALYTNVASPAAKLPSHPPNDGNGSVGGNQTKYHNKNHNSGHGGGHNDKNSTGGGGHGGSSGQTPPPLAGPTHRGRLTTTCGRGT